MQTISHNMIISCLGLALVDILTGTTIMCTGKCFELDRFYERVTISVCTNMSLLLTGNVDVCVDSSTVR